jgi:hypothetical protein
MWWSEGSLAPAPVGATRLLVTSSIALGRLGLSYLTAAITLEGVAPITLSGARSIGSDS